MLKNILSNLSNNDIAVKVRTVALIGSITRHGTQMVLIWDGWFWFILEWIESGRDAIVNDPAAIPAITSLLRGGEESLRTVLYALVMLAKDGLMSLFKQQNVIQVYLRERMWQNCAAENVKGSCEPVEE